MIKDQTTGLYLCDQCDTTLTWGEVMVIGEMVAPSQLCHRCYIGICRGLIALEDGVQNPVIKFKKLHPDAVIPSRATLGSAGFDLYVNSLEYESDYDTIKVWCGVAAGIPAGYVGILSVRSSTYKYGLELVNQIGVIDSDFVDEIFIRLKSNGLCSEAVLPDVGTRIAQMIIVPFFGEAVEVEDLPSTTRKGGCGSTGK